MKVVVMILRKGSASNEVSVIRPLENILMGNEDVKLLW